MVEYKCLEYKGFFVKGCHSNQGVKDFTRPNLEKKSNLSLHENLRPDEMILLSTVVPAAYTVARRRTGYVVSSSCPFIHRVTNEDFK